jgi:hippurate hydrolase
MLGTVRALSDDTRTELHAILRRVAGNVAKAHGMEADVQIDLGYPVVVNDPAYTAFVDTVARRTLGDGPVRPLANPSMGGEDWAYVLREVPGTMSYLGACLPDQTPGKVPGNHSNRVVFDEEAMLHGMAMHAAVAMAHGRGEFTAQP